jgi:hypothetical protein
VALGSGVHALVAGPVALHAYAWLMAVPTAPVSEYPFPQVAVTDWVVVPESVGVDTVNGIEVAGQLTAAA